MRPATDVAQPFPSSPPVPPPSGEARPAKRIEYAGRIIRRAFADLPHAIEAVVLAAWVAAIVGFLLGFTLGLAL